MFEMYPQCGHLRVVKAPAYIHIMVDMDRCRAHILLLAWSFNLCETNVQGADQSNEGPPMKSVQISLRRPGGIQNQTQVFSFPHVSCPRGHLTLPAFACDVTSFCWASHLVLFSRDRESWELPPSSLCPVTWRLASLPPSYACAEGAEYVPYTLVCDYRQDCLDGSDENFCVFPACDFAYQFQCRNKQVRGGRWGSSVLRLD